MIAVERALPHPAAAARAALYAGRIFLLPPMPATLALAEAVQALIDDEFGGPGLRRRAGRLPGERLFAGIGRIRRTLFTAPAWHAHVQAVLQAAGFCPGAHPFDPLRLRTVLHRGHERPEAAPVYLHHRDTWYAHPPATVTGWIPLDDLAPEETFLFFPDAFAKAVPNDSEVFDFRAWTADGGARRIGWQGRPAGPAPRYPAMTGTDAPGEPLGFACRRGSLLLFSGAHLHATRPQATGRARFSLDFRFAHRGDVAAGHGAPDVDNRSTGSAFAAYVGAGGASVAASATARSILAAGSPSITS